MAHPVRWLGPDEDRAWRGYRRMRMLLDLQLGRDLERHSGLSEADYDVLSTLTEGPEPRWRANELASRLLWSSSRLAHQVSRMEARGLVTREPCTTDGRGSVVSLTEAGWAVLREAAEHHVESVRENFIDVLSPTEIRALRSITEKVIEHLPKG